jgi:hypothetical protein
MLGDNERSPFAPCEETTNVDALPCLTVHGPWGTFIALLLKSIEARTHDHWHYLVGKRIGIHAGKAWNNYGMRSARYQFRKAGRRLPPECGTWDDVERLARLHAGHLIATAKVTAHKPLTARDSEAALCDIDPGDWGFVLDEVRTIEPPFKVKGQQGVWAVNLGGTA